MTPKADSIIVGQRYGLWSVVSLDATRDRRHNRRVVVKCECGTEKPVRSDSLLSGGTRSCGCEGVKSLAARATKHGMALSPTYIIWAGMCNRCSPRAHPVVRLNYADKGVTVCERWRKSFALFFADMGVRPSNEHSIDRINPSGNYEPDNCRWATRREQQRNRRDTRRVTYKGQLTDLVTACERAGLPLGRVKARLRYGWTEQETLTK